MATNFINRLGTKIGTSDTLIYSTSSVSRATVIGFNLTNTTRNIIKVSVQIVNDVDNTTYYYAKNIEIPENTTYRLLNNEKLILASQNSIHVLSNVADSLDVVMSAVEVL
jgi:hypothetical protein